MKSIARTGVLACIVTCIGCDAGLGLLDELTNLNAPKVPAAQARLVAARYQAGNYPGTINSTLEDLLVVYHFTYTNGVTLHGLTLLAEHLNSPTYRTTVANSFIKYTNDDLYRADRATEPIDYLGSMAHATIAWGIETGDRRFESQALAAADYFLSDVARTPDGLIAYHDNPSRGRIWADALYMTMPLLAKAGAVTGDTAFWDEVLNQFDGFSEKLRNTDTGLYHQGWNWHGQGPSPGHWGRANGWVAAALAESLSAIPADYPGRDQLLTLYQSFMGDLARVQGPSGMWHQLLDDFESYPETSCTGLIMYAMSVGVQRGWLDESYAQNVAHAYDGLSQMISLQGDLANISPGTPTQSSENAYRNRGPATNDAHGIGPVLLGLVGHMQLEARE